MIDLERKRRIAKAAEAPVGHDGGWLLDPGSGSQEHWAENDPASILAWCDETAMLRAENERVRAEVSVYSGESCREEQSMGNGPCGACRSCLPGEVGRLRAENDRLRRGIRDALDACAEDNGWDGSRPREILREALAEGDAP